MSVDIRRNVIRSVVEQSRSLLAVTCKCAVEFHGRYRGTHSHIGRHILKLQ
jgi:hypothetical protein